MSELDVAARWLYATLKASPQLAAIGVFDTRVEGAGDPVIVFQALAGTDANALTGWRVWTEALYQVKVIGTAAFSALAPIERAIDDALHRASGSATGGTVVTCVREQVIRYIESPPGGTVYRHTGGNYRLRVQRSNTP